MTQKPHHSSGIPRHCLPGTPLLWKTLPAWVHEQDDGTTQRLLGAFQEQAAAWQHRIEQTRHLYDPTNAPAWALDPLLRTWGLDPPNTLKKQHKRRLIRWAVPLLQRAGTAAGIEQAVRALTGCNARCFPWNQGWTLDTEHQLDQDTNLAASLHRPQDAYAFDVAVQGRCSESQRNCIRGVVEMLRPVHCPLREIAQRPTPLQQETQRLLARCSLCLARRGQQQHDKPASSRPPPCSSWQLDPSAGLLLEPTRQDGTHAALTTQADALAAWSKAGNHDLARALLWGLTRLPFHGAAVQDPATGKAAHTTAIANLVLALAEYDGAAVT